MNVGTSKSAKVNLRVEILEKSEGLDKSNNVTLGSKGSRCQAGRASDGCIFSEIYDLEY
jgi:hypothetical protein